MTKSTIGYDDGCYDHPSLHEGGAIPKRSSSCCQYPVLHRHWMMRRHQIFDACPSMSTSFRVFHHHENPIPKKRKMSTIETDVYLAFYPSRAYPPCSSCGCPTSRSCTTTTTCRMWNWTTSSCCCYSFHCSNCQSCSCPTSSSKVPSSRHRPFASPPPWLPRQPVPGPE